MVKIIEYNDILDTIVSELESVNTTTATYDLSSNLSKRIVSITRDDLEVRPKFKSKYPVVSVRLDNKVEEAFSEIAAGKWTSQVTLNMNIRCIYDSFSSAEDNLWYMVRNVESNLRLNSNINAYKDTGVDTIYTLLGNVDFAETLNDPKTDFNKSANIDYQMVLYLKDI